MKVNIKGTNMDITDAIRSHVMERVDQIEKYINPEDTSAIADIEVGKTTNHHQSGDIFRAEINLHIAGSELRAESETEDLYASVNDIKEEIIRQIRKTKEKHTDGARKGGYRLKKMLRRFWRKEEGIE